MAARRRRETQRKVIATWPRPGVEVHGLVTAVYLDKYRDVDSLHPTASRTNNDNNGKKLLRECFIGFDIHVSGEGQCALNYNK